MQVNGGLDRTYLFIGFGVVAVLCVALFFVSDEKQPEAVDAADEDAAPFDAFAGGYPVPPMSSALSRPADRPRRQHDRRHNWEA